MIEIKTITNKNEWDKVISDHFPDFDDVYFRHNYFSLHHKHFDVEPEAVYWQDKNLKIFWTYLKRKLSKNEYFKYGESMDKTTPYGYGGPLVKILTSDNYGVARSLKEFFDYYCSYSSDNCIVSEFIRFHPISEMWKVWLDIINLTQINDVVTVDLTKGEESIWQGMKKSHRYSVRKSRKEGSAVSIIKKPTDSDIDTFIEIYSETMLRNKAGKKYYFSKEFLSDHFSMLDTILIQVEHRDQIIGMSMFMLGGKYMHYHLSGTVEDVRGLYPSNAIIWEAIRYGVENGYELLHLGGGRGRNDSLFDFKKGFSGITFPFYIGKLIFDHQKYEELIKSNPLIKRDVDFFPAYRYGLDEEIV